MINRHKNKNKIKIKANNLDKMKNFQMMISSTKRFKKDSCNRKQI